jgi:hypothetical protein
MVRAQFMSVRGMLCLLLLVMVVVMMVGGGGHRTRAPKFVAGSHNCFQGFECTCFVQPAGHTSGTLASPVSRVVSF